MSERKVKVEPYQFDVFISYADADIGWVNEWLLPRLQQAGFRVLVRYRDFTVGGLKIENRQQAVDASRRTIAVLTPDWLEDEWAAYETALARSQDPTAGARKILPLILKPCEPPALIADLEAADMTDEQNWPRELKRLIQAIQREVPPPSPTDRLPQVTWYQWLRWALRYYRWYARLAFVVMALLGIVFATWLRIPPFDPKSGWQAEPKIAHDATILHNAADTLLIAGNNTEPGCEHPDDGLWYRSLAPSSQWQVSNVLNDALCLPELLGPEGDALSDIVALSALPEAPDIVYALTSHSGLLVSHDGGRTFDTFMAADDSPDVSRNERISNPLLVSNGPEPTFWVLSEREGLQVYRDERWTRLDSDNPEGCRGLSNVVVTALLVIGETVLVGTDQDGLWLSDDLARTCRPVFDVNSGPRYEFRGLWDVSAGHPRYLALVREWYLEPQSGDSAWQLLNLCPRVDSCDGEFWRSATEPVWVDRTTLQLAIHHVLVQHTNNGNDFEWYLATDAGQIFQGDLSGSEPQDLPDIRRCYNLFAPCDLYFAPVAPGERPYLLAADRIYSFAVGPWWRVIWP